MKIYRILITVLMLSVLLFCSSDPNLAKLNSQSSNKKIRTYLLPLESGVKGQYLEPLIRHAIKIFPDKFKKSGNFIIIEDTKNIPQQYLSVSEAIKDSSKRVELANLLNAEAVVYGSISLVQYKQQERSFVVAKIKKKRAYINLEVNILDINSGKIIASAYTSAEIKRTKVLFGKADIKDNALVMLKEALDKAMDNIVSKLSQGINENKEMLNIKEDDYYEEG